MDVGSAQPVWAALLPLVHRFKLLPVALHEAQFEDELAPTDEFLIDLLPVGDHGGSIRGIAK